MSSRVFGAEPAEYGSGPVAPGKVTYTPEVVTRPGAPRVYFLALKRHFFPARLTLTNAARFKWPIPSGQTPASLVQEKPEEVAKLGGYWRKAGTCGIHPGGGEHFCWERSVIEDLFQAEGGNPAELKAGPIPVKTLRALDVRLLPEWKKQLIFVAEVRMLYNSCTGKGAEGEREFEERYQALHTATWEAVLEVRGLPPPSTPVLEPYRTVPPPPAITGAALAELAPQVMLDYPVNDVMPRHIARWMVEKVPKFLMQDWTQLFCVYHRGVPDLQQTRLLVERHRLEILFTTVPQCLKSGGIHIPPSWQAVVRFGGQPFEGNTRAGVNQVVAAILGLTDEQGKVLDCKVINASMLWCAKDYPSWGAKYNIMTQDGKTLALHNTVQRNWRQRTGARQQNLRTRPATKSQSLRNQQLYR